MSDLSRLTHGGVLFYWSTSVLLISIRLSRPPPFFLFAYPKMPDPTPPLTPSATSSDNEEYSSSPVSKREYLLAQMKQKDTIIESLLKQVRSHVFTKPFSAH